MTVKKSDVIFSNVHFSIFFIFIAINLANLCPDMTYSHREGALKLAGLKANNL